MIIQFIRKGNILSFLSNMFNLVTGMCIIFLFLVVIQELRASRTSMDAESFDDLSGRLYHDFLREENERKSYITVT
jgi:hypothetical protein